MATPPHKTSLLGSLLRSELGSFSAYFKRNWRQALPALSLGVILFWAFLLHESSALLFTETLVRVAPPLSLVLLVEWLVLLSLLKKSENVWAHYRKTYFVEGSTLSGIDTVLIAALPLLYAFFFSPFLISEYFIWVAGSAGSILAITYINALISSFREQVTRWRRAQDNYDGKTELFSDEPIDSPDDDLIGREQFAIALKENIYNLSFRESFVMALYGKWGEGKTSILNLLKRSLREDGRLLIYEFDPWFFGGEEALTTNFYRGLEDTLEEHSYIPKGIKETFRLYPEVLLTGVAQLGITFKKTGQEDRPAELKKRIEQFVSGLDKKILVLIDDIDRLQKDEILAVFRLIKLTSHIRNVVFLISLDDVRVCKILKASPEAFDDPQSYIEKIVQLPISLPMTDQAKIDSFLLYSYPQSGHISAIDKLFDRLSLDKKKRAEFDEEFVSTYRSTLQHIFSTYRASKRYLNSIFFRLPFVEREVNLYDFFIVEVFQTFFPDIYADMKTSPWYYISQRWSLRSVSESPLDYDDKKRELQIKDHAERMTKNTANGDKALTLLQSIFPEIRSAYSSAVHADAETARINKRISHPDCYFKYFMLGTREGLIADAEFEDLLTAWKEAKDPQTAIERSFFGKYQKESKLVQLLERLKLHSNEISPDLILPIIDAVYKNIRRFNRDGGFWSTEYDHGDGLILRLIEDRKDVIKDGDIHNIIKKIIETTPGLDLASLILLTCKEVGGSGIRRIRTNVRIDELRQALDGRNTAYFIVGKVNIFDEYPQAREYAFILYQWATNWSSASATNKEKVSEYLISLFREKPTLAAFFLQHNVKKGDFRDDVDYFDYQGFVVAYDPEKFANFLKDVGDQAYSTVAEESTIKMFLEKHEKAAVPAEAPAMTLEGDKNL